MPLWGNADSAAGAPKFKVDGAAAHVPANTMYDNVTSGAFKANMAIGVFAVTNVEADKNLHAPPGWVAVRQGTGPVLTIAPNAGGTGYGNLAAGQLTFPGGTNCDFHVASTNSTGGVTALILNRGGSGFINVGSATLVQPANGIYSGVINAGGSAYDNTDVVFFQNGSSNAVATPTTNSTGGITGLTFSDGGRGFSNVLNTVVSIKAANGGASNGSSANITPTIATGSGLTVTFTLGGRAGRLSYESLVAMGSIVGSQNVAPFPNA